MSYAPNPFHAAHVTASSKVSSTPVRSSRGVAEIFLLSARDSTLLTHPKKPSSKVCLCVSCQHHCLSPSSGKEKLRHQALYESAYALIDCHEKSCDHGCELEMRKCNAIYVYFYAFTETSECELLLLHQPFCPAHDGQLNIQIMSAISIGISSICVW